LLRKEFRAKRPEALELDWRERTWDVLQLQQLAVQPFNEFSPWENTSTKKRIAAVEMPSAYI
jgi:hypothetical protein